MTGILIDVDTGDLLIQNSSVVIGDTDSQVTQCVLEAMRGEFKEYPLIGGEVRKMLSGNKDKMWINDVKKMLRDCGVEVNNISLSDNIITVE